MNEDRKTAPYTTQTTQDLTDPSALILVQNHFNSIANVFMQEDSPDFLVGLPDFQADLPDYSHAVD